MAQAVSSAAPAAAATPAPKIDPAYAPIADDPRLRRVLLIGDSVSVAYTLAVRQELASNANVHRPPANCGSTKTGLRDIDQWLGTGRWDVIHFNWGLHDLGYRFTEDSNRDADGNYARPDNGGHQHVPPALFEKNLRELAARLHRTGAKLIFATTTPVPADLNSYVKAAELPYNEVARRVMREAGVTLNDLWTFATPQLAQLQIPGNPHFTAKGSAVLAREIARVIATALPQQIPAATPPAPAGFAALDLGAAIRPAPLAARFVDENFYIWCGSMTRTADGRCHLYYSRWPRALGHNAWVTHSEIAYAVADDPLGPFRHVAVTLPPRGAQFWDGMVTHNPNILRIGKKLYLYYMGNRGDGKSFWVHRNNQRVGLAVADDPRGPWQRRDQPIVDVSADKAAFDSLVTTNPAACLRPDGGVLLIYKAVTDNGTERGGRVRFGAAIAVTPEGPYVKQRGQIFEPNAKHADAWMVGEDPFVWFSERFGRKYYALSRDVVGMFTGATGGITLLESADGLSWTAAARAAVLGKDFAWADGTRSNTKLERPQLYLDDAGLPRVLYGAVDVNQPANRSHSFNVAIPIEFR